MVRVIITKNDRNNFILLSFPSLFVFTRLSSTFLQAGLFEKRIKSVAERRGNIWHALSENISHFFIGCRITRFDCKRLVLASKFHEEPHYNRRIFGYIRGCSGVTDGTPGNCIGDITHEPASKAVRSAPPRINWSTNVGRGETWRERKSEEQEAEVNV